MKYLIDTAEQVEINKWAYFVEGVTSNPKLLDKAGINCYKFFMNNEKTFDNIFIQVTSLNDIKPIIDDSSEYDQLILKVPLIKTPEFDGYALLKDLVNLGYRTCSTIVYDISQFNYACEVGAEFSIVLHAKNDNHNLINECYNLQQKQGFKTKTIAASFRTPEHVFECIRSGADYATVPPKIMTEVFRNPQVLIDYNKFYEVK